MPWSIIEAATGIDEAAFRKLKQQLDATERRLNTEERESLEKFERGELRRGANADDEMETARQAARDTFNKTRINLRVTERDFNLVRAG